MSTHQDKSLETLQATVRGQLLVAGGNGFDLSSPEFEPALAKQTQIITAVAQKYADEQYLAGEIAMRRRIVLALSPHYPTQEMIDAIYALDTSLSLRKRESSDSR